MDVIRLQLKEEILIHEQLRLHSHPSIVRYHGVKVEDGFVVGIVLDKLDVPLREALAKSVAKQDHAATVEKFMKEIQEGLEHLHSLGIMHVSPFPCRRKWTHY